MTKSRHNACTRRAWTVMWILGGSGLFVFVLLVVHRNAGAARERREAPLPATVDVDPSPHAFTTHRLPTDERFMCSVGNGHVATDVFSSTVYMNGLYNGEKGESHRARIPAWHNVRLNSTLNGTPPRGTFTLDTDAGAFFVRVEREWSNVEQRIYAHRFYTRAIINQILIEAKHKTTDWRDHLARYVDLSFLPGADSKDIEFETPMVLKVENRVLFSACGKTMVLEDKNYQEERSEVCAYWTYVPARLVVPRRGKVLHTFVMTVDKNKEVALKEMTDVLQEIGDQLFSKHKKEWKGCHRRGKITIGGNNNLAKIVNGVWYYLLSSLPSFHTNQPEGMFYGLSPGGLSRGGLLKDYEGHNFWDTELWMFPSILLMYPDYADTLLRYRFAMASTATDLARKTKNKGLRFPWESAFTGQEVTQPCCPEVADFEHHISGCIAFAARQYLAVTGNDTWLRDGGCALIMGIADFWFSRSNYNETTRYYDINNVMGPDEDHVNVTNSVFTNVVAGFSLYLAQYVSCLCGSRPPVRAKSWGDLAARLALPMDPVLNYHPQFSGYQRPDRIKQADVVLLGFPLQYSMNESTRANDLAYYERVTRETGPAMTWSMHAVGHLRLGDYENAASLFMKSYQGYVREPFKVWTEYRKPRIGAVNFLTGMGGFLQAIIFGYAGLHIHLDKLEIIRPQLLPQSTRLKIDGFKYLGTSLVLDINTSNTTLKVISVNNNEPLVIIIRNTRISLKEGTRVNLFGDGPFEIRKEAANKCPLPLDLIGQMRGKIPPISP